MKAYLPNVAVTLNNLGLLYSQTNRVDTAEKTYYKAQDIYLQLAKTNPETYLPSVAATLNNLAILYRDSGRMDEAIQICQAMKIYNVYVEILKNSTQ